MLRPFALAALAALALALAGPAAEAAPAAGFGAGPGRVGPGRLGPARVGPRRIGRPVGFRPDPAFRRAGRGYGRGYAGFGYGGFGYGGLGYGGLDYGASAGDVGGTARPADGPDYGYRIVTAPGIEEKPPGRPVVYVLDAPRPARSRVLSRDGQGRWQAYGGEADPEYGPRIVTLSVPRR